MSFDIDIARKIGSAHIALQCRIGGGLVALLGPSGVGKTSILNMIAGLIHPDRGHIAVGGDMLFDSAGGINRAASERQAGYIFQERRLFPHMRVRRNLTYGRRRPPLLPFDDVIALLGLTPLLDRWPATLSGGEAQRVAIGRALLSGPRFLLMDEPLSSIDAARKGEIMQAVEDMASAIAIPILYVTHDEREADRLASTIIRLQPAGHIGYHANTAEPYAL